MVNSLLFRTLEPLPVRPARGGALGLALAAGLLLAPVAPATAQTSAAPPRDLPASFADLATSKLPSVVTITASSAPPPAQTAQSDSGDGAGPFSILPDSPLRDFMEDLLRRQMPGHQGAPEGGGPHPEQRGPGMSLGSGFIIDPAGYVVTNNHVVEGADKVEITLTDKRKLSAKIVGTDPKTDLALLKVEPDRPLPTVAWGDSDGMRVGDWVVAIGNPFGLGGTVTAGIISARARDLGAGPYDDFLQTDAAINRGNSGGPMFNLKDEVIGVNSAIYSQSGGNIGIGFAIPSALAGPIIAELREKGRVTRGYLGVSIQPVGPDIATALDLKQPTGALVANVSKNSPASKAGVASGDVVTEYNGKPIKGPHDLTRMVAQSKPGDTARIMVQRDGKPVPLEVRIAELQPPQQQAQAQQQKPGDGQLGLTLAPMTPELRKEFSLDADTTGAVVVQVAPNSPAARSGFQPGDVITRAGQQAVADPGDVSKAVDEARKANRDRVLLLRRREDNALFVPLPLG
ncbi:DegQ family serine endoprotease [Azospirillum rugosum]|uniref:Probable periplasmic serine endoprotease DegP-like n=1 Tax=Azospirillum rugosum TaxID=416170 RepID=A0ABS4SR49_9PROT|nr:DegQ family serine endoprotease [Azospirillum rugosum]MBP2295053.1 serine protease Do [Azospirillum rugosum]MDQ0528876.1 serine protease Do [Azospirillum rugosum]